MAEQINETIIPRREFKDPVTGKSFYIAAPNAEHVRGADWQYSKIYTKSLIEGITTSSEMMDILLRRGIIGPEFDQRQAELTRELTAKVETLRLAKDLDEKQKLAIGVSSSREDLFNWNQRLNGPMSNTCEQIADDARLEYLTTCMIQDEGGKRVWEDYSDFLKEKNQSLAMRARFEVMLYLQGLEPDFLQKTPEAQAMKEIEAEIREKAKEALAKLEEGLKAEEAKEAAEEIEESAAEEPEVKARGRKKKTSE
jgi:hypothetical protein